MNNRKTPWWIGMGIAQAKRILKQKGWCKDTEKTPDLILKKGQIGQKYAERVGGLTRKRLCQA
jgi:hypothetical protein